MKTYKFIELLSEIELGNIKERTKIERTNKDDTWKEELIYLNGGLITECGDDIFETYTLLTLLHSEFTLIEEPEEIDIKGIEEIDLFDNGQNFIDTKFTIGCYDGNFIKIGDIINELIKAVKQLDRKINKKYCCNCGVELDKNNTALPNMCKECKYGEE